MLHSSAKTNVITFILFIGIGLTLKAQSVPQKLQIAVFPAVEPLKLWLTVVKPQTSKAGRIELVGSQKQLLYLGSLSKKEQRITQLFNLSEVSDGLYTLRVITPTDTVEKSFYLQSPLPEPKTIQRSVSFVSAAKMPTSAQ